MLRVIFLVFSNQYQQYSVYPKFIPNYLIIILINTMI